MQEARIPLMLIDGLVVYRLSVWEKKLKAEKEKVGHEEDVAKETDKKTKKNMKAAQRFQAKAREKKNKIINEKGGKQKHNIMQPDKSKKM